MHIQDELTPASLVSAYQQGQRVFRGVELVAETEFPALSDATFRDAEFIECWFHSTTFVRVDFAGAKFRQCNLKCTAFTDCNLENTAWEQCLVCAIAVYRSQVANVQASGVNAYGVALEGGAEFLKYALANGSEKGSAQSAP